MNSRKLENLAPAGTPEALEKAIAAGADAVYLGFSMFSARAGAGNFDREALEKAIRLAHLHHVRVHVTVNTLIFDRELEELSQVLDLLYSLHADAVLVQDLGVLRLLREAYPDMTVHASTQMSIHNRTGAAFCRETGIRRVVLARECTLKEIRACTGEGVEIEVFSHGAQCVAVSGQCLFSSWIGGRSGNRGRCAQPCRLMYRYRGEKGAFLSPRDVCTRMHVLDFLDAGVSSLKIEGRLKRPEYVAVTAGCYARAIRDAEDGRDSGHAGEDMKELKQIFQRGGFMDGYAFGAEDAGVIDLKHVSHRGVEIGHVTNVSRDGAFARIRLTDDLHDGDQLSFSDEREGEMIYTGADVPGGQEARVRLRPGLKMDRNGTVRRLVDASQLARANRLPMPGIPVRAHLNARAGEKLSLEMTDGISTGMAQGDVAEAARTRAMDAEGAYRAVSRLGDTPFTLSFQDFTLTGGDSFVPVSVLNSLRRACAMDLEEKRIRAFEPERGERKPVPAAELPEGPGPSLLVFRDPRTLAEKREGFLYAWRPGDYREARLEDRIREIPEGSWFCLPVMCEEDTLQMLRSFVRRHRDTFGGVVIGSVGQLGIDWTVPFGCGSGVPVMNRQAAAFLFERGAAFVTASTEMSMEDMLRMRGSCGRILLPAYGRAHLMLLHTCPARVRLGLKEGHSECRMCDTHARESLQACPFLEDMHGARYPLVREALPEGCMIHLLSPEPINRLKAAGNVSVLVELTDETDDILPAASGDRKAWIRSVE